MVKPYLQTDEFHVSGNANSAFPLHPIGMKETEFKELICNRFMLAVEATGLSKKEFGARVGLTPSQMTNIKTYRNPPSRSAIARAVAEFGFTTDYFYMGVRAGMRDPVLTDKIRAAKAKLGIEG